MAPPREVCLGIIPQVELTDYPPIDIAKVPLTPETEEDPKRTLINLSRKSRKKRLAREIVPEVGSSAPIGPLYNFHFIDFVNTRWNIDTACQAAPSLAKTLERISLFLTE